MALGMRVVRCVLILVCGMFFLMGTMELVVWLQASSEPEPVTMDQWGTIDGTLNRYIKLTDFTFDDEYLEYSDTHGTWHYIPLKLSNGDWPERPLVVAQRVTRAEPNQWENVYDLSEITGVVSTFGELDQRKEIDGELYQLSRKKFKTPVSVIIPRSKPPSPVTFGTVLVISGLVGLVCGILEIPLLWKDWSKMVAKQNEEYRERKQAEEQAKETFEI